MKDISHSKVWPSLAKHWSSLGPPLRPSEEDLRFTGTAAESFLNSSPSKRSKVVVLGVTPELCQLKLPGVGGVTAVDSSEEMIQTVWPGPTNSCDLAIQANWDQIPLEGDSVALILFDGSLTQLSFPGGQRKVFAELHRLLRPGGQCIFRCFIQGQPPETAGDIFEELKMNLIGSFHVLKWRVAMSLQVSAEVYFDVSRLRDAKGDQEKGTAEFQAKPGVEP